MKKTVLIFSAFMSIMNFLSAQDRNANSNSQNIPQSREERIEQEKKNEEIRMANRQREMKNTTLTEEDRKRLEAIERDDQSKARDTPPTPVNGGVPTYDNKSVQRDQSAVQSNLTPDQRYQLQQQGRKETKAIKQAVPVSNNITQRKPVHETTKQAAPTPPKQEVKVRKNMSIEEQRAYETAQYEKSGNKTPTSTTIDNSTKEVNGMSDQQLTAEQQEAINKRRQLEEQNAIRTERK